MMKHCPDQTYSSIPKTLTLSGGRAEMHAAFLRIKRKAFVDAFSSTMLSPRRCSALNPETALEQASVMPQPLSPVLLQVPG